MWVPSLYHSIGGNMKYRKKPVIIEAFRFQIDNEMPDWFNDKRITNEIVTFDDGSCDIWTLEGVMHANKGDYIILGVKGEVYPCKPDIFEQTYDKAYSQIDWNNIQTTQTPI